MHVAVLVWVMLFFQIFCFHLKIAIPFHLFHFSDTTSGLLIQSANKFVRIFFPGIFLKIQSSDVQSQSRT